MSEKGSIKTFFLNKGFGFIKYSGGEIFFHIKDVTPESSREKIIVGINVEFVLGKGKEGKPAAKQIKIISQQNHRDIPETVNQSTQTRSYKPLLLPKDTRETIDPDKIDNFSLMFNKAAYFEDDKFIFYKRDKHGNEMINLAKKFNGLAAGYSFREQLQKRHNASISKLFTSANMKSTTFPPDWRLIIGIGHESVYETSITLHHIYGIPYIPGQAIKGVTRSWIITEVFGSDEGNKHKGALSDSFFCRIFGSPKDSALGEHQGSVMFFDAFPITTPELEMDIMNPHYSDYYSGKIINGRPVPPADYLNPVPIPFLTVGKKTKFEFIVGMKKRRDKDFLSDSKTSPIVSKCDGLTIDSTLPDIALAWLKKALTEHGIGAKTAVGYGYFEELKNGEQK